MQIKNELLWGLPSKVSYKAYLMKSYADKKIPKKRSTVIIYGGGGFITISEIKKEQLLFIS